MAHSERREAGDEATIDEALRLMKPTVHVTEEVKAALATELPGISGSVAEIARMSPLRLASRLIGTEGVEEDDLMDVAREHPGVTAPELPLASAMEAHDCLRAAVIVCGGRRVWYPCRSHEGGVHNFAAHWPHKCPASWCRLPRSHYLEGTMHDIPGGVVETHDAIGAVNRA